MPSPTCTVNATSTANGVNVSAASTITIALADTADVRSWSITCVGRDEAASAPTLTVDTVTKTATFTSGAAGSAYIFRSLVNGGVDQNGVAQASYATTFAVYVLTAGGDRVMALGEGVEGSASFGWISQINAAIRKVSGGDTTLDDLTLTGDILIHKDNATPAILQAAKTATASTQAGTSFTWTAQSATAGTSNAGAGAGGGWGLTTGAAAFYSTGNANGGDVTLTMGAGVGTGRYGRFGVFIGATMPLRVSNDSVNVRKLTFDLTGHDSSSSVYTLNITPMSTQFCYTITNDEFGGFNVWGSVVPWVGGTNTTNNTIKTLASLDVNHADFGQGGDGAGAFMVRVTARRLSDGATKFLRSSSVTR